MFYKQFTSMFNNLPYSHL